jgi:hypothetical protein
MRFKLQIFSVVSVAVLCLGTGFSAWSPAYGQGTKRVIAVRGGQSEKLLRGKIEQRDGFVRLQRPALPKLATSNESNSGKVSGNAQRSPFDLGADGFSLNFNNQSGVADDTAGSGGTKAKVDPLVAEAENDAMVIAWENWHRRVCQAIFERWRVNGNLPGVGHARLRFTRDRHIEVIVEDIRIDDDVYSILPIGARISPEELDQQYRAEILDSVQPLDGSPVLAFPENSKRREVVLTPAFRGTRGPANFTWKKDDYEHIQR